MSYSTRNEDNGETFTIRRDCLNKPGKETVQIDSAYDRCAQDNGLMVRVNLGPERRHELIRFPDCELAASILSGLEEFFTQHHEKPLSIHHVEENLFKATFKREKGRDIVIPLIQKSKNWHIFVKVREKTWAPYFQVEFSIKRATVKICKYTMEKCLHCLRNLHDTKAHDMVHRSEIQFCVQILKVPDKKKPMFSYLDAEVKKVTSKLRRAIQNQWADKVEDLEKKKRALNSEKMGLLKGELRAEQEMGRAFSRNSKSHGVISRQRYSPVRRPKVNAWFATRAKQPLRETRQPANVSQLEGHSDSGSASSLSRHSSPPAPARPAVDENSSVSSWENQFSPSPSPLPRSRRQDSPSSSPPLTSEPQEKAEVSIGEWLRQLGPKYERFIEAFEDSGISIMDLATDTDREDLEDLGVTKKWQQTKLLNKAKRYFK